MAELAAQLHNATVVVLGDLVADEYLFGETDRVSREAPVPIVRWESVQTRPGGAANVVANVAALGAKARCVGLVGADTAGRALLSLLQEAGADASTVVSLRDRCTETKTRILAGGRSTTRQQMLRVDRADDRPISSRQRARLVAAFEEACRGADVVVVSDYGGGLVDDALAETLRKLARKMPVCVDSRYDLARFSGVTVAKPNEPELEAAVGRRLRTADDIAAAGRSLRDELGVEALVVTRGQHGLDVFLADRVENVPVWGPSEAVDVTGAGDTVLATLACAMGSGADIVSAARLANVAGGIVVQKSGTATCSAEELAAALASPKGGRARGRS